MCTDIQTFIRAMTSSMTFQQWAGSGALNAYSMPTLIYGPLA